MELTVIQNMIYEIRGVCVMLDFDLARLYQIDFHRGITKCDTPRIQYREY